MKRSTKPGDWWWWAVVTELALIPLTYVAGWITDVTPYWHRSDGKHLEVALRGGAIGLIAVVPMIGLYFLLEKCPWKPLREIKQMVAEVAWRLCADRTIAQVALLAVVAGFGEEFLFRGWLQYWLRQMAESSWTGVAGAILITSLLFGLFHAITPLYFGLATAIGAYFGLLFVLTGTLEAPVVTHAVYDFFALLRMRGMYHPEESTYRAS